MQAAFYERLGRAADVLIVGEVPTPTPGPGQVRVRIAVSGLNPSDIKGRDGFKGAMPYPRVIPHQDGAGVIDAVGEGVSTDRVGQRVWVYEAQTGQAFGTAAEYVLVPADRAVPLHDEVSFEVGASLGIAALTAHYCLFADGSLQGRRVLVHGGVGVVGEAAILLAKWAGAWVATTVRSAQDREAARKTGADRVMVMGEEDVAAIIGQATGGHGVDRIVEVDPLGNLALDMACLAKGGVVSCYSVGAADATLPVPVLAAMVRGAVFRFVLVYSIADEAKRQAVRDVDACLAAGGYRPTIGRVYLLEQVVEAHEALEQRSCKGKILLRVGP